MPGRFKKDYREFCTNRDELARIESHMQCHNYVPIDDEQVGLFLETAYQEVRELSQRYLLLINSLVPQRDNGTALTDAPVAEREGAEIEESDQDPSADGS